MKINWKVRLKNPYFWTGLIALFIATLGVAPETLTSWQAVLEMLKGFISNPFAIVCVVVALIGYINDPTTKGFADSKNALTYEVPKDDNIQS